MSVFFGPRIHMPDWLWNGIGDENYYAYEVIFDMKKRRFQHGYKRSIHWHQCFLFSLACIDKAGKF